MKHHALTPEELRREREAYRQRLRERGETEARRQRPLPPTRGLSRAERDRLREDEWLPPSLTW